MLTRLRAVALATLLTVAPFGLAGTAHADQSGIDFDAYLKATKDDYSLGQWVGYGFRTADGFRCKLAAHMSMSAVDCHGPFIGAPDGATAVHVFSYSPGADARPVEFHSNEPAEWADPTAFDGHPLRLLPEGSTLDALNGHCVHTAAIMLACRLGSAAEGRGFVATSGSTSAFGG